MSSVRSLDAASPQRTPSTTCSRKRSERTLANVRAVNRRVVGEQQAPRERLVLGVQRRGLDDSVVLSLGTSQRKTHGLVVRRDDPSGNC